jgi:hypothetical protein
MVEEFWTDVRLLLLKFLLTLGFVLFPLFCFLGCILVFAGKVLDLNITNLVFR